jgi:hypothetical protein
MYGACLSSWLSTTLGVFGDDFESFSKNPEKALLDPQP